MVVGYPSDQIVSRTCQQFEWIGILYSHALKVLDMRNVKLFPEHYVLKRWSHEARCGTLWNIHGRNVLDNPKIDATQRYQLLSRKFLTLSSRATDFKETYYWLIMYLTTSTGKSKTRLKNLQLLPLINLKNQHDLNYLKNYLILLD